MNAIERYSDWGYWDRLDGINLKDDEELIIEWPDGQLEQTRISVVDATIQVSDHGKSYDSHSTRCFVKRFFRGVQVEVPLVGLKAQRAIRNT